jgi:AcrR family transcriptional regulator
LSKPAKAPAKVRAAAAAPQATGERRATGRPARISRERILDEARQIPARELSMHVIARRLGVNVAALYYHFESRDALFGALVAQLSTEFPVPVPDPAHWRQWLLTIGHDLTRFLIANPVILSVRDASQLSHVGAVLFESVLETLEPAGFSSEEALRVWKVLTNHIYAEARFAYDRGAVQGRARKVSAKEMASMYGRDLPRTREMIAKLAERTTGEWLEDWLRWLIALLPEPPARST